MSSIKKKEKERTKGKSGDNNEFPLFFHAISCSWIYGALLVIFGFCLYYSTLHYPFVYDDDSFIVLNPAIRSLKNPFVFLNPKTLASQTDLAHDNYRPLVSFSYAVNYYFGKLHPFGYRLFDILLHIINCLLVFTLTLRILRQFKSKNSELGAFAAASVFLAHPVQVETVVWVSQRSNIMAFFFSILALYIHLRKGRTNFSSLALFVLALLCKEEAVVMPIFLYFWLSSESWISKKKISTASLTKKILPPVSNPIKNAAPYVALVFAFVGIRFFLLGRLSQTQYWAGSFYLQMLTMTKAFSTYFRLMIWPNPLSLEYLFPVAHSLLEPAVVFSSILILGVLAGAFFLRRRNPLIPLGVFIFFTGLGPVSNIIPIKAVMAERFLYFSVMGFGIIAASLASFLASLGLGVAICVPLALYGALTIERSHDWKNAKTLILATLRTCPQSARMHYGLGRQYAHDKKFRKAAREFQIALNIDPSYHDASQDLGKIALQNGDNRKAIAEYRKTLQVRVDAADALAGMGAAYLQMGKPDKAVKIFKSAYAASIKKRSDGANVSSLEILSNLAVAYGNSGHLKKAISLYKYLLSQNPRMEKAKHNLQLYEESLSRRRQEKAFSILDYLERFSRVASRLNEGMWTRYKLARMRIEGRDVSGFETTQEDLTFGRRQKNPYFFLSKRYGTMVLGTGASSNVFVKTMGSRLVPGFREKGIVIYSGAYSGADSVYVAQDQGMESLYFIHAPLKKPLSWSVSGSSKISSFILSGGNLEAVDRREKPLFQLSPPKIFDSGGKTIPGKYMLKKMGASYLLTLQFNDSGLRYPLVIDPTWTSSNLSLLNTARYDHTATLLPNGEVLVAGGFGTGGSGPVAIASAELYNPQTNTWTTTGSMTTTRAEHTATLLPNGTVLVTGGEDASATGLSTAEIYNPATGIWSTTGSMSTARQHHTATLLQNGKVLVAGGSVSGSTFLSSAEIYDPASGTWSTTPNMNYIHDRAVAVLLPNGNVLVATGLTSAHGSQTTGAEIYNPSANTWTTTGSMLTSLEYAEATLLPNGQVLLEGGDHGTGTIQSAAYLYNPTTGSWATTGSMTTPRYAHASTLLPNGKVLVTGGINNSNVYLSSDEMYDPSAGTWSTVAPMTFAFAEHTATLLPDGNVLLAGGGTAAGPSVSSSSIYIPISGTWNTTGSMSTTRENQTATLLPNGEVLAAGGSNGTSALSSAEIYNPSAGTWSTTGAMSTTRENQTATLLPNGEILAAGGSNGTSALSSAEIYNPSAGTWSTTGAMSTTRENQTATLLPNGEVLAAGGSNGTSALSSAEIYNPSAGTWSTTGSMSTTRENQTATLLPNGKVLVSGGSDGTNTLSTAEIYDPEIGTWATTNSLTTTRENQTATLLPNGNILIAGGSNGTGALSSSEESLYTEYDFSLSTVAPAMQPVINTVSGSSSFPVPISTGSFITITGSSFTSLGQGDGGGLNNEGSPVNYPRVYFRAFDSGNYSGDSNAILIDVSTSIYGSGEQSNYTSGVSASSLTFQVPSTITPGYYLLSVEADGVPSSAVSVQIPSPPIPICPWTTPVNCAVSANVEKNTPPAGCSAATSIGSALTQLPTSASGNECVVIRDTATYSEQVTIQGFTPSGGYTGNLITIMADPTFVSSQPVVNPPAASTAAFEILNASVTIQNIAVVPTNSGTNLNYGINASSNNITISSVVITDIGGYLNVAAINIPSNSNVISYSSVTAYSENGISVNGVGNIISFSSVSVITAGYSALYIDASSNTATQSFLSYPTTGYALYIDVNGSNNTVSLSTITSSNNATDSAASINGSSNTIAQSYISNPLSNALNIYSSGNTVRQSTITSAAVNGDSVYLGGASSNTISQCDISESGSGSVGLYIDAGSVNNSVSSSLILGGGDDAYIAASASSNTITNSYLTHTGLSVNSNSNTISFSTITDNGASGYALYLHKASSNTISHDYFSDSSGYGLYLAIGSVDNSVSTSVILGAGSGNSDADIMAASNTITNSAMTQEGLSVYSDSNTISFSTITSVTANSDAVYLGGASFNTILGDIISEPNGDGVYLDAGSSDTAITQSTITSSGGNYDALYIVSPSNLILNSYIQGPSAAEIIGSTGSSVGGSVLIATNTAGYGLHLGLASDNFNLSSTTIITGPQGIGIYLSPGNQGNIVLSTNTILGAEYGISIATQAAGTQVWIASNTIISTMTASNNTYGIYLNGLTTGATIYDNGIYYRGPPASMGSYASYGLYAQSTSGLYFHHNRINNPGMITGGSFVGAYFTGSTGNTFKFNDVNSTGTGLTDAYLIELLGGSTGNAVNDNIFVSSFVVTGSSASIDVGAASEAGLSEEYNDWFSLNSANTALWGGANCALPNWAGCSVPVNVGDESIALNPLWYNPSSGVEDFHPMSPAGRCAGPAGDYASACSSFVTTDVSTSPTIDAADPAESFALEPLPNGNRANQGSTGDTLQASKSVITCPSFAPVAGCSVTENVFKNGCAADPTIKEALNELPKSASGNECVVIRDTSTYSEQVTIQGFTPSGGYTGNLITIMADPTFVSSQPVVNPPAASTAAFEILNASVTIQNIAIVSTNAASYGILASSANATLAEVYVSTSGSTGNITSAGISISSNSEVSDSSVTLSNGDGLDINGSSSTVTQSTITANNPINAALYLDSSSSDTIMGDFVSAPNPNSYAFALWANNDHNNTISQSTITGNEQYPSALLELYGSSSDTVTNNFISNPSGYAIYAQSDHNSTDVPPFFRPR